MSAPGPLVVLAAGGTGGHVFPAEALAPELAARGARLILFTDRRGGVAVGGALASLERRQIRSAAIAGRDVFARLHGGLELVVGVFQARAALKRLAPWAVVGFGGYASVPSVLAASLSGHLTVIHEQNAVLGRANRLLARRAERIATAFDQLGALPDDAGAKVVHTGMPVRPGFTDAGRRAYAVPREGEPIRLLVLGGSQGAAVFSQVIPDGVARLNDAWRRRLRIRQQCRPEDLDRVRQTYRRLGIDAELASFFDDVPAKLAEAHALIARAGASTVAEVAAVGRPAIFVPYPHAADDHQSANARAMQRIGAAWVMPQDTFSGPALAARLEALFASPAVLENAAKSARAAARPDAVARLADVVFEVLESNGSHRAAATERRAA